MSSRIACFTSFSIVFCGCWAIHENAQFFAIFGHIKILFQSRLIFFIWRKNWKTTTFSWIARVQLYLRQFREFLEIIKCIFHKYAWVEVSWVCGYRIRLNFHPNRLWSRPIWRKILKTVVTVEDACSFPNTAAGTFDSCASFPATGRSQGCVIDLN